MQIIKIAAAAALLAGAATLALAQTPAPNTTNKDSPSKAQPAHPIRAPASRCRATTQASAPVQLARRQRPRRPLPRTRRA